MSSQNPPAVRVQVCDERRGVDGGGGFAHPPQVQPVPPAARVGRGAVVLAVPGKERWGRCVRGEWGHGKGDWAHEAGYW